MSKPNLAGAAALLVAPLLVIVRASFAPTVSDDAGPVVRAFVAHHGAMVASAALEGLSIALFVGATAWLAIALFRHAPRLALAGGILAVAGGLVVVYEDGLAVVAPSLVGALGAAQATAVLEHVQSGAAAALSPLALLQDVGIALLGLAAPKAGAPRWVAPAVVLGAVGEGVGFGAGNRLFLLVGFALLFAGFVAIVHAIGKQPAIRTVREPLLA